MSVCVCERAVHSFLAAMLLFIRNKSIFPLFVFVCRNYCRFRGISAHFFPVFEITTQFFSVRLISFGMVLFLLLQIVGVENVPLIIFIKWKFTNCSANGSKLLPNVKMANPSFAKKCFKCFNENARMKWSTLAIQFSSRFLCVSSAEFYNDALI